MFHSVTRLALASWMLIATGVVMAGTPEFLTSFSADNGTTLEGGLTQGGDGSFYGVASAGGRFGRGTLYKMTPDGTVTVVQTFSGLGASQPYNPGVPMGSLLLASDGYFYGTTSTGGFGGGTLFKMSMAGEVTVIKNLPDASAGFARSPSGSLIEGADGSIYGTTELGGAANLGVMFKMTKEGVWTNLVEFTGNVGARPGAKPRSGVMVGPDGAFYGTTYQGGSSGRGVVFRLTTVGSYSVLHSFSPLSSGLNQPIGGLVTGVDGKLWGTTFYNGSGTTGYGGIYKITTGGVMTPVVTFTGVSGAFPGRFTDSTLLASSDGFLYGTTYGGGANSRGVFFKVDTSGNYSVLHDVTIAENKTAPSNNGLFDLNGAVGRLSSTSDGGIWGVMRRGGSFVRGAIFSFNAVGGFQIVHEFHPDPRGAYPIGKVAQDSEGNYWGLLAEGGDFGFGAVYKLPPGGSVEVVVSFTGAAGDFPGASPVAGLVTGADGRFYGATSFGGAGGLGTIFAVGSDGQFQLLAEFSGVTGGFPGAVPSGLVVAKDRKIYGVTETGGVADAGTFFSITTAGVFKSLASFKLSSTLIGAYPHSVAQGPDGNFYGGYYSTDQSTLGVYRVSSAGRISHVLSFTGNTGAKPGGFECHEFATVGSYMYGVTEGGGDLDRGTLFRLSSSGAYRLLHSFGGDGATMRLSGGQPSAGLARGPDGWLYGSCRTTDSGDPYGRLFRLSTAGAYELIHDFDGNAGRYPASSMTVDSGGRMVGVCEQGSTAIDAPLAGGTVYRIETSTSTTPLPQITTLAPTDVAERAAIFHATLGPSAVPVSCTFVVMDVHDDTGGFELGPYSFDPSSSPQTIDLPYVGVGSFSTLFHNTQYTVTATAINEAGFTPGNSIPFKTKAYPTSAESLSLAGWPADSPTVGDVIYNVDTNTSNEGGATRTIKILSFSGSGKVYTDGSSVFFNSAGIAGVASVRLRIADSAGGVTTATLLLHVGVAPPVGVEGVASASRGRGESVPGLPGSFLAATGIPSQTLDDQAFASGTVWKGKVKVPSIIQYPGNSVVVGESLNVGGASGYTFRSIGTVLIPAGFDAADSPLLFPAVFTGPSVTSATDGGVFWCDSPSSPPILLAREGDAAPGGIGVFSSFLGLLLSPDKTVLIAAKLRLGGAQRVTTANDVGIWAATDSILDMLLREGDSIPSVTPPVNVRTIYMPQRVPGSSEAVRYGEGGRIFPKVQLSDGSIAILSVKPGAAPTIVARTGTDDEEGRRLFTLGYADFVDQDADDQACFVARWKPGIGGVTTANDSAIVLKSGSGTSVLVREGDDADLGLDPIPHFVSFSDPVAGVYHPFAPVPPPIPPSRVVFVSSIAGTGISSINNECLWQYTSSGAKQCLAREGDAAPGTTGVQYSHFISINTVDADSPNVLFTASLKGRGVSTGNNVALFSIDPRWGTFLLLRKGQPVLVGTALRVVKSFSALALVPDSPGQQRQQDGVIFGAMPVRVAFTDGSSAILRISTTY